MSLKEFLFCPKIKLGSFELTHREGGCFAGVLAFALIFSGSTIILTHTFVAILQIAYAFAVLLPLSYYQMKQSRGMI